MIITVLNIPKGIHIRLFHNVGDASSFLAKNMKQFKYLIKDDKNESATMTSRQMTAFVKGHKNKLQFHDLFKKGA